MSRIVFITETKSKPMVEFLLAQLKKELSRIIIVRKWRSACESYAALLMRLSELLPYPIIRNLDEKLGITLAWNYATKPSIETKSVLMRKIQELKPSDIQSILDEFAQYFNISLPNIEDIIQLYLEGKIGERELTELINSRLR